MDKLQLSRELGELLYKVYTIKPDILDSITGEYATVRACQVLKINTEDILIKMVVDRFEALKHEQNNKEC